MLIHPGVKQNVILLRSWKLLTDKQLTGRL